MTTGRFARKVIEVPPGRHWAILSDRSGEEFNLEYRVFTNEREFLQQLQDEVEAGKSVVGMEVSGVYQSQVTTTFKKVE